jgi:hypothetical protein
MSAPKPRIRPKDEPCRPQGGLPSRDPPAYPERDPPAFTEHDMERKPDERVLFHEDDCLR